MIWARKAELLASILPGTASCWLWGTCGKEGTFGDQGGLQCSAGSSQREGRLVQPEQSLLLLTHSFLPALPRK